VRVVTDDVVISERSVLLERVEQFFCFFNEVPLLDDLSEGRNALTSALQIQLMNFLGG